MKLCLIGSTRFIEKYHEVNRKLTLAGHLVYSVATVSTSAGGEVSEDEKETLDLVHLRKITESDAVVLITDKTGYIGASTRREIKWAQMNGKDFYFPDQDHLYTEISNLDKWIKARASDDPQAIQRYYADESPLPEDPDDCPEIL